MSDITKTNGSKVYKTVLLGGPSVGKTCIKKSYLGQQFREKYSMTVGTEFSVKRLDKGSALQVWDIPGTATDKALHQNYIQEAEGAILVFDLTKKETLRSLNEWKETLDRNKNMNIPLVIVGNKCDIRENEFHKDLRGQGIKLSRSFTHESKFEVPYVEVSAKTGLNVDHIFDYLVSEIGSALSIQSD